MQTKEDATRALQTLVRRRRAVDLEALFEALGTRSRMTVFRRLKETGYFSSFSHGGRYYTLTDIPTFDELGLWFCDDVGFSRAGTLKETIARRVDEAPEGQTHAELQHVLRLRVHNTLHELVQQGRIGRVHWQKVGLYVSANPDHAAEQVARREELTRTLAEVLRTLSSEETIEVLVEALRATAAVPTEAVVAERLAARDVRIEPRLIEQVYETYGLVPGKKRRARRARGGEGALGLAAPASSPASGQLWARVRERLRGSRSLPRLWAPNGRAEDGPPVRPDRWSMATLR